MTLLQEIRDLLRPAPPPVKPQTPARRAGKAVAAVVMPAEEATADDLAAVLEKIAERRTELERALGNAAADRDKAVEADDIDALAMHGQNIDRALAEIELLDRREPQILSRLREIKGKEKAARYLVVRDAAIAAARAALPALQAAAEANEKWLAARAASLMEFPDAFDALPGFVSVTMADVEKFRADINRGQRIARHETPQPLVKTARQLIDEARRAGLRPPPGPFNEDIERALKKHLTLVALLTLKLADGEVIKKDAEFATDYETAARLVETRQAIWKE